SRPPRGYVRTKKVLHTFRMEPSTYGNHQRSVKLGNHAVLPESHFTRARPRLSGIIAREALSHHNISWRIQVRPARRGLRPRTLRRSSVIRVPQSRETRPERGHQSSLHWTDERGIRTPGPHRSDRSQLGWTLPCSCNEDRERLCLLRLRTALWHNGHNVRPL